MIILPAKHIMCVMINILKQSIHVYIMYIYSNIIILNLVYTLWYYNYIIITNDDNYNIIIEYTM